MAPSPSHTARPRPASISRRGFLAALGLGAGALAAGVAGCAPGAGQGSAGSSMAAQAGLVTITEREAAPKRVTLAMVGDVLVHPGVWKSGERADGTRAYDHLYAQVRPAFEAADIAIVNQETILGGTELGLSGYPSFNSPQELADAEVTAGVDVALAATNHALDKGYRGIQAELAYWREHHPQVVCTGIYDSQEAYDAVSLIERNGVTVALLNYTESTNGIPIPSASPWCVAMLDRDKIARDVEAARAAGADAIVACPHWGTEYVYTPTDAQREWASYFCEAGVDAIIGTHPHVIEPLELLSAPDGRSVPVFWSLGNFISWQSRKDTMVGGLAELSFEKTADGIQVSAAKITPVITHLASDTAMSTYPIASYTEELAQANAIRRTGGCSDFSLAWCQAFCQDVLGAGYDPAAGSFTLV